MHEAYLRLVKHDDPGWQGPRHFFGSAARAMREILIEQARRKGRLKHGVWWAPVFLALGTLLTEGRLLVRIWGLP